MAVYDRVHIYSSDNLKDWKFESEFGKDLGAHGGVWECPDLFPSKVEGSNAEKWVMLVSINPGGPNDGSATQYFTGDFDGHKFTPDETTTKWIDWGRDNYAGVTWSNIPASDGRRIFIGWMSNWKYATVVPTKVWRSASTLPRKLFLKVEEGHYTLISRPVAEFSYLLSRTDTLSIHNQVFSGEKAVPTGSVPVMQSDMNFVFDISGKKSDSLGIILENSMNERFIVGYSGLRKMIYADRKNSGITGFSKEFSRGSEAPYNAGDILKLHLIVDAASVELFVDDGRMVMTNIVFPSEKFTTVKLFSAGAEAKLEKATMRGVSGIWKQ